MTRTGGYDYGYKQCKCFWGRHPARLVQELIHLIGSPKGWSILDVGCGEGKNAIYLARLGARVVALDISPYALKTAQHVWPDSSLVSWIRGDVACYPFRAIKFDAVIAYGLFHCLKSSEELTAVVRQLKAATKPSGYHVVCTFNVRRQELRAHPGFNPLLPSHAEIVRHYSDWNCLHVSDSDLFETHPHNRIPHVHSLTRLLVRNQ